MHMSLIRFEALRLFRQPRSWVLMFVLSLSVLLPLVLGGAEFYLVALGQPLLFSVVLGAALSSTWGESQLEGAGSDLPYALTRAGTRTQLLVARWVLYSVIGVTFWSVMALAMAARGRLSEQGGHLSREAVALLTESGHPPTSSSRDDQPRPFEELERPRAAETVLVATFLCFLLGVVGQTASGPPRMTRRWKSLFEPGLLLQLAPLVGVSLFFFAPPYNVPAFLSRQVRIFTTLYLHSGAVVALSSALMALYAVLSVRAWKRADV